MALLRDARPHLMTVAEYMASEINDRTELVGRVIYDVSPRNEPHRYAVRDSTDRRVKIPLHANAGVPAWIVNTPQRRVESYANVADLELEYGRVVNDRDSFDILGVIIPVASPFAPAS